MKEELIEALAKSLKGLEKRYQTDLSSLKIDLTKNKNKDFGDYSSNLALIASKNLSEDPKKIAEILLEELVKQDFIHRINIAGPGFINFFLSPASRTEILRAINEEKDGFGFKKSKNFKREKILIEYVSSNPTGPLHVGHGRGAAFGSALSKILTAAGHEVDEEYYVNDQGRQMDILALSLWFRYLQKFNERIIFPNQCYKGNYIKLLAKALEDDFKPSKAEEKELLDSLSLDLEEEDLDKLIIKSKEVLKEGFETIKSFALNNILKTIKDDLKDFGVTPNKWFKESSMFANSKNGTSQVEEAISVLNENNYIYKKDGALWFRSTDFDDEKDRVVKRDNGLTTYFASDIAYHANKYKRGYTKIINIWGADHHGYLPRVRAAMAALGEDTNKFEVIFIQFANLIRGGKKVSMSTRGGEFISLNELIEEVTSEAARFFYINRKGNQHLDFDLDLAKEESKDNPLYYVQYAHARICSVFEKLKESGGSYKESIAVKSFESLKGEKEAEIQGLLSQFPEVITRSAKNFEPHLVCYYLRHLAGVFHSYYNSEKILVEEESELQAKLFMLSAVRQVIFNGLNLLSISAPKSM